MSNSPPADATPSTAWFWVNPKYKVAGNHGLQMAARPVELRSEASSNPSTDPELELGRTFAQSLASKDFATIEGLLHPNLTFRGLTPGKARYLWESHAPHSVVTDVLQQWFEETDRIDSVLKLEVDRVVDRNHVSYRFSMSNPDGRFVVEQQAYYSVVDGRIAWMSVVCSGPRPV